MLRGLDIRTYGPKIATLLESAPLPPLGPGAPLAAARPHLAALTPEHVTAPRAVADRRMALACHVGLWLRYDFLDQGHTLCQAIEGPDGDYWHGIMHRREPDFANAKYWFRRVGDHSIHEPLRVAAARLAGETKTDPAADFLRVQDAWGACGFVDLCEFALDGSPPIHRLCQRIQQFEWELLFDHCFHKAVAT
jgi:hypothetical protein